MSGPALRREGDVFVLDLGDGENRLNPGWVGAFDAALDEVQAVPAPRALVTTARGKVWSNGLDLDWLAAHPGEAGAFLTDVHELLARLLTIGIPTLAALQGHTFAAGAMLAAAHDQRVMRADRGFFCLPEVNLGIPFTPAATALLTAGLPAATAHEAMTTGRRYDGGEALDAGIVAAAVAGDEVLPHAITLAASLAGADPAALRASKARRFGAAAAALRDPAQSTLTLP